MDAMRKLSSFGRDTGLQLRMATDMFLLGLVYVAFVGALLQAGVGAGIVFTIAGVMAHELSHVANRDVMVMTLASFFATIAAYIVQFGFYFGGGMGGGDDEDSMSFIAVFF